MILVLSFSCLCPIHWSWALCREWRCSWSSADRRCSNYIWVIMNLIVYYAASFIRGLTVVCISVKLSELTLVFGTTTGSYHFFSYCLYTKYIRCIVEKHIIWLQVKGIRMHSQTFSCWNWNIPVKLGQFHGCSYIASSCHLVISTFGIDSAG